MNNYVLTYRSTMCNPKIYASKFLAISIFMNFENIIAFSLECVSLRKSKQFSVIALPKHMQTLLYYHL